MDFGAFFVYFYEAIIGHAAPFLFILLIIILFHELGHFLVARWCGVDVKVFSLGFGPEIFGWYDKRGTRWRVAWFPLGGYVMFDDDDDVASLRGKAGSGEDEGVERKKNPGSFHIQAVYKRAAVVAAGPIANFIVSIVIFTLMFWMVGERVMDARIDLLDPDSAAVEAGFQSGDVVRSVDDVYVSDFNDLKKIISSSPGRSLSVVVERDRQMIVLSVTPRLQQITDASGNEHSVGVLGVRRVSSDDNDYQLVRHGFLSSFYMSVKKVCFLVTRMIEYMFGLVAGSQDVSQLGGPLKIMQMSGQAADIGFVSLINLAAFLSVSVGLLNLFPLPLLDGGHLFFYTIEAIKGGPLSYTVREWSSRFGFLFLLILMLFITWNDILSLIGIWK